MLLAVDQPGGEAIAEDMAAALVAAVEALRVRAVQTVHPRGELDSAGRDDEVVVRTHQADRVDAPAVPLDGGGKDAEEIAAVLVVEEDEGGEDADGDHVVRPVRKDAATNSGHAAKLAGEAAAERAAGTSSHSRHDHHVPSGRVRGSDPRTGPFWLLQWGRGRIGRS
jgi:hypothetical protein